MIPNQRRQNCSKTQARKRIFPPVRFVPLSRTAEEFTDLFFPIPSSWVYADAVCGDAKHGDGGHCL